MSLVQKIQVMNSLRTGMTPLLYLLLVLAASSIQCRPFGPQEPQDRDPMLAIPSEKYQAVRYFRHPDRYASDYLMATQQPQMTYVPQEQVISSSRHQQETKEHQQYVLVEQSPETGSGQQAVEQAQQHQEEYAYMTVYPDGRRVIEQQPQMQPKQLQQSQQENTAANLDKIVYIGQDRVSTARPKYHRRAEDGARHIGDLLSENPGLAATILTEVPIKDMPMEVLEKLRKDYGIKVVATRSAPGANLVINCDDYNAPDSIICAQKHMSQLQSTPMQQQQPETIVSYEPAQESEDPQTSREQPQIPDNVAGREQQVSYAGAQQSNEETQASPAGQQEQEQDQGNQGERYVYVQEQDGERPADCEHSKADDQTTTQQQKSTKTDSTGMQSAEEGQLQQQQAGFDAAQQADESPESDYYMRS